MLQRASYLVLLLSTACSGEESLTLRASPGTVPADGVSLVNLTAKVIFRDEAIADGKRVRFVSKEPLLFETREEATPQGPGLRPVGEAEVVVRTVGGVATAWLIAPTASLAGTGTLQSGLLEVTASFTTVNDEVLRDTVAITIQPAPLVASGSWAVGGFESNFFVSCARGNVGAFVDPRPEIRMPCSVAGLVTQSGDTLDHVPVRTFVEAGQMQQAPATDDEPRTFTYVVPAIPSSFPYDTQPFFEEAAFVELPDPTRQGLIPGARELNPRDGLVTILAVVRGHEAFDDDNGNGTWDPGEEFKDEAEPFLDVNDDGVWEERVDGALCCDNNGNGRADGPNGRWDRDVWIGRVTHVLWSGPVDKGVSRSGIGSDNWSIAALGGQTFSLTVVDAHFNPVAAHASGDRVVADLNPGTSRIDFEYPFSFAVGTAHGFVLDTRYPDFLFDSVPFSAIDTTARSSTFRLVDQRTGSSLCSQVSWDLTVEVQHTPATDHGGADFSALSSTLDASGVLELLPEPCPPP